MKRLLVLGLCVLFVLPVSGQVIIRRGGFVGVAPIYNYDDCDGVGTTCTQTNINFWANFENCTDTGGSDCPQDGTEYVLDATTEHTADADGCAVGVAADLNGPHIIDTSNATSAWVPMIEGSTQGLDVDFGDNEGEYISCDNSGGSVTGEAGSTSTDLTGCIGFVMEVDSLATNAQLFMIPSFFLEFEIIASGTQFQYTFDNLATLNWTSPAVDTPYFVELSYILGTGNDSFELLTNGTSRDTETTVDVGVWNLVAGSDIEMGLRANKAVDMRMDLVVIRSCTSGCDCASDSLWEDIAGTCDNSADRCINDAQCGAGNCNP